MYLWNNLDVTFNFGRKASFMQGKNVVEIPLKCYTVYLTDLLGIVNNLFY